MLSQVQERYEFGPFRLDPTEHTLLRDDQVVALTPKAFETLALLVRSSGHLVRKEELIERVWRDTIVEEGNLNVIIHTLRKALGDDPREHKYIETVAKCGYRFVAEVRKAEEHEETASGARDASAPVNGAKQSSSQPQITTSPSASVSRPRLPSDRRRLVAFGASVLVVALAATFFFLWRFNHRPIAAAAIAPAPVRSIAVLPFRVLSGEKGDEYLSLGLADALITSLSQTRQVIVRQTDAVAKYQNTGKDPLEAGREQGVDAVLEGQVQRIGDRVRVTARLVRTSDGTSLWADRFEEKFTNIFAVEDAVAEKVARTTILAMKGAGEAPNERLTKRYTENNDAYESYLSARLTVCKRHWVIFSKPFDSTRIIPWLTLVWPIPTLCLASSLWLLPMTRSPKRRWPPKRRWLSTALWPKHTRRWANTKPTTNGIGTARKISFKKELPLTLIIRCYIIGAALT